MLATGNTAFLCAMRTVPTNRRPQHPSRYAWRWSADGADPTKILRLNRRWIRQSKSRQIHSGPGRPACGLMLRHHVGINPATNVPARRYASESGRNCGDDLVQHVIGHFFVKSADVAEAPHVHLERLELDAKRIGDVLNGEVREVGLTGERAVAGELRNLDVDQVIPTWMRVGESVQRGLRLRGLA